MSTALTAEDQAPVWLRGLQLAVEIVPVTLGGERVPALQERGHVAVDQLAGREALDGSREAVAHQAAVGLDPDEHQGHARRLGEQRHPDGRHTVGGRLDARDLHEAVTP